MNSTIFTRLKQYAEILMSYNQRINLVSRKMTLEELFQLIDESLLLFEYISKKSAIVVDAGSGNGLLGIPVAMTDENRKVVLVEPKQKKSLFLQLAVTELGLKNVDVQCVSIEEYLKSSDIKSYISRTLISRGFPELSAFCGFLKKGLIDETVLITSENKLKKNRIHLEKVQKKIYNVHLRDHLKILKMENIERE